MHAPGTWRCRRQTHISTLAAHEIGNNQDTGVEKVWQWRLKIITPCDEGIVILTIPWMVRRCRYGSWVTDNVEICSVAMAGLFLVSQDS